MSKSKKIIEDVVGPAATLKMSRSRSGLMRGTDQSGWAYFSVNMGPVENARTERDLLDLFDPLSKAFEELALMTPRVAIQRRRVAKSSYRFFKLSLITIPQIWRPSLADHKLAPFLRGNYPNQPIKERFLLLGIKLRAKTGNDSLADAMDSITHTFVNGGVRDEDFEQDFKRVSEAMTRIGLTPHTAEQSRKADAWWNQGSSPSVMYSVCPDHIHMFSSVSAAATAEAQGLDRCREWALGDLDDESAASALNSGHRIVSFSAVEDLDLNFDDALSMNAHWMLPLIDADALNVTITGLVEPSKITRNELRERRRKLRSDAEERASQLGSRDLGKAELDEAMEMAAAVEAVYAKQQGTPTLVDTRITVAFDGMVEDLEAISAGSAAELRPMTNRQYPAWVETMLCSPALANPYPMDLPTQTIVASGIQSLSRVGDADGILDGFTEKDLQPAWYNPKAAHTDQDSAPLTANVGASGSGKLVPLDTPVITPGGPVPIGELKGGDLVLARDGAAYPVTDIEDHEASQVQMMVLHLEDGRTQDADANHQWIVCDRGAPEPDPQRRQQVLQWSEALRELAEQVDPTRISSAAEILRVIPGAVRTSRWLSSPEAVRASLRMMDVHPVGSRRRRRTLARPYEAQHTLTAFKIAEFCQASIEPWQAAIQAHEAAVQAWVNAVDAAATPARRAGQMGSRQMAELLISHGAAGSVATIKRRVVCVARDAGIEPSSRLYPTRPLIKALRRFTPGHIGHPLKHRALQAAGVVSAETGYDYPRSIARKMISTCRLREDPKSLAIAMTKNARAAGLSGQPMSAAIAAPAWSTKASRIELYELAPALSALATRLEQIDAQLGASGEQVLSTAEMMAAGKSTRGGAARFWIRTTDPVLGSRIELGEQDLKDAADAAVNPAWLNAELSQRWQVLEAMMEARGTVVVRSRCELACPDRRGADFALDLVRSLGLKAWTRQDGERLAVCFITQRPLFSDEVRARRQRTLAADPSARWIEIVDITAGVAVDSRCISVDSPDHSYLLGGYLPTHNTQKLMWDARQTCELGEPQVLFDPKMQSDMSPAFTGIGPDRFRSYSLDKIFTSDGVFDPIRYSASEETGVELALDNLMTINPWGTPEVARGYERELMVALNHGVSKGADCTGIALQIARDDGRLNQEIYESLMEVSQVSPMFGAMVGTKAGEAGLKDFPGTTLIKVGTANLSLPEPGQPPVGLTQRLTMALVKSVVFGASAGLAAQGGGVLRLDEAWVFLSSRPEDIQRLARVARSQGVDTELYTQKISDALDAKISGFITRGHLMHTSDEVEARAALELFGLGDNPRILERVKARSITDLESESPNWRSLRHLMEAPKADGSKRRLVRGSVALTMDVGGSVVPVVQQIPSWFIEATSTNPEAIARREREEMEAETKRKLAEQVAQADPLSDQREQLRAKAQETARVQALQDAQDDEDVFAM